MPTYRVPLDGSQHYLRQIIFLKNSSLSVILWYRILLEQLVVAYLINTFVPMWEPEAALPCLEKPPTWKENSL